MTPNSQYYRSMNFKAFSSPERNLENAKKFVLNGEEKKAADTQINQRNKAPKNRSPSPGITNQEAMQIYNNGTINRIGSKPKIQELNDPSLDNPIAVSSYCQNLMLIFKGTKAQSLQFSPNYRSDGLSDKPKTQSKSIRPISQIEEPQYPLYMERAKGASPNNRNTSTSNIDGKSAISGK